MARFRMISISKALQNILFRVRFKRIDGTSRHVQWAGSGLGNAWYFAASYAFYSELCLIRIIEKLYFDQMIPNLFKLRGLYRFQGYWKGAIEIGTMALCGNYSTMNDTIFIVQPVNQSHRLGMCFRYWEGKTFFP